MELTIDQPCLSRALRLVGRAVPARTSLPILQTVLLDASQGRLQLSATDLELGLVTAVAADVGTPGHAAVPARLLGDYVAQLPAEPIRLALDETSQRVRITGGRFAANLAATDVASYPAFPTRQEDNAIAVDAGRLRQAIERVAFAAARDETRPVLTGVLFDFGANGLTLGAADSFRLARARLADVAAPARRFLVPARAVAECGRLLADAETARLIPATDARGLFLTTGETTLFTRLIEGQYPNLDQVVPLTWSTRVVLDTASFRQAIRVAGLFGSTGDARPVVLRAEPNRLQISAQGDETGDALIDLGATVEGESQAIAVNTRLLADIVDAVADPRLSLAWSSPAMPLVIREAERDEPADVWVSMPMHLTSVTRPSAQAA